MKKFLYAKLNLALFSFFATSCMTIGNDFPSTVKWIDENKTSLKEIENYFGAPFRTGYDSGLYTYTYAYYKYSAFSDARTKDLTIRFNKNKTVHNFSFFSSFMDDKKNLEKENVE